MKYVKIFFFLGLLSVFMVSCGDDENGTDPTANFSFEVDSTNPLTVNFTNTSSNASSYSWDFGDGNSSQQENPSHTFGAAGDYDVTLAAQDGSNSKSISKTVSVSEGSTGTSLLFGDSQKTWKLSRNISGEEFPLIVGPSSRAEIWWALGINAEIGTRPCLMNEEYVFGADGTYEYKTTGEIFADEGIWNQDAGGKCVDETNTELMTGPNGEDLSAWGSGSFTYEYNQTLSTLTVNGEGAHIGLAKLGSSAEVTTPQNSVTYNVVSLVKEGAVTKMALETTIPDGYWRINLISYDNPADEPELPGAIPSVSFDFEKDGSTVMFTNNSSNANSYMWDFGDGNSSTESAPSHTYAQDGQYTVVLTATNDNGNAQASKVVSISVSSVFSAVKLFDADNKKWVLDPNAGALAVGPGKGSGEWFATSADDVTGRACTFDDTYEFSSDGAFTYQTNGDLWAEMYMGVDPAGCINETDLSADAAVWGSGSHMFTVTESTGDEPAYLTLIGNGAFIGLPKVFNGGEYAAAPPTNDQVKYEVLDYIKNENEEKLILTIDISEGEVGGAYWTFTLIAQ